jgi:hypothetical protein
MILVNIRFVDNDEVYVVLDSGNLWSKTDIGQGVCYSTSVWEVPLSALHAITNAILNRI